MASCVSDTARSLSCRDGSAAANLKLISIAAIFVTSVVGISSPVLLSRYFQGKPAYDKATLVIKCFAAGVILSTSLVHVLPDAFLALSDCRVSSHHPWKDYPFSGLVTMIGALTALLVDLTATSHMESHSVVGGHGHGGYEVVPVGAREELVGKNSNLKGKNSKLSVDVEVAVGVESNSVGGHGHGGYEVVPVGAREELVGKNSNLKVAVGVESNSGGGSEEMLIRMKQRLVSQVLEIGIIFHSVIIGVTMGMSQNQCTIRPLVAALSFHQIFEGMGLGGCIAQAGFKFGTTAYMCFMFAVTTPMGIVLGMILFSVTGYDDSNPNALILEGLLGSFSSGILIYMALVDLIALDFFHNKMMSSNSWLRKTSFVALVLGSTSMSILALWA